MVLNFVTATQSTGAAWHCTNNDIINTGSISLVRDFPCHKAGSAGTWTNSEDKRILVLRMTVATGAC